ncbi:MAG TPA: TonB-dependent receptor [Blastocatellia bacterium]|nr:TonB-dependent receptor [Blastocatellia bacterium]
MGTCKTLLNLVFLHRRSEGFAGHCCSTRQKIAIGGRLIYGAVAKLFFICVLLSAGTTVFAQQQQKDLSDKSLDELVNIQVTSVSKKEQKLFQAAAAVYVITQEDIRRSGLSSIPELLRMVPGLEVAQVTADSWAISSRGFNGQFANKMLVLIDGRSIYTHVFSGVFWDLQDLVLEDIERIEVIRGPGATIWGANAVNGVINIVTKRASSTQGGLVDVTSGNEDRGIATIRYGGKIGERAYYRAYTKYSNRGSLEHPTGPKAGDGWDALHSGFRLDWQTSDRDSLTIQGDLYRSVADNLTNELVSVSPFITSPNNSDTVSQGGNIQARWERVFSPRSDMTIQFYYDHGHRRQTPVAWSQNTIDFDFTHHLLLGSRHDIVWGAGFRSNNDQFQNSVEIAFIPAAQRQYIFSAFAQDEITVVENRLHVTVGSKIEHDSFSGFNTQPSVRISWTPSDRQTIWASVSHALRSSSRFDRDLRDNYSIIPIGPGMNGVFEVFGNPNFAPEVLNAFELGYRMQPNNRVYIDLATFYNKYRRLETIEVGIPVFQPDPSGGYLVVPGFFDNKMRGAAYGAELSATWNVGNRWKLVAGYSWLTLKMRPDESSNDTSSAATAEGSSPHHQFKLQSFLSLPHKFEFDASIYYVDKLPFYQVPAYTRLDLRLGWRLNDSLDFSIGGQNLLSPAHLEFGDNQLLDAAALKRTAFGKITWRF